MRGVARLGDRTMGTCSEHGSVGGTIITASADVDANFRGIARLGDVVQCDCGHTAYIITACFSCKANDRGVARLSDLVRGSTYSGTIVTASADVSYDDETSA